jgi:hypothetical protein
MLTIHENTVKERTTSPKIKIKSSLTKNETKRNSMRTSITVTFKQDELSNHEYSKEEINMEGKMNDVQTSPLIPKEIDVESTLEIGAKNHLKKRVAY